ncbi:MAG TPA: tripartite tricarboxylate transporter substrate binding protein [Burkholderiales bacterium]|nr:tripartite tricarboxylate transporter substrate binding protein [Burkholderiales bacterium]
MHLPCISMPIASRGRLLSGFSALALGALLASIAGPARAQAYPTQPIRFIVPYTAGGGVDAIARTIGQRLSLRLGQPVVIDNHGGAAGNIGTELAARAEPNGYTIMMGAAALAINVTLYPKLSFDPVKDFVPISLLARTPNILAVYPQVQAKSVKELIALAKAKPGALNYASAGSGTTPHLAGVLFCQMAGVQMVHVPYKGSGPAVTGLLAGEVDLMLSPALTVLPYIKANRLRALATTGAKRSAAFPELPTVAEAGLPGFEASQWYAVLAPARTPKPIIDRLNAELVKVVQSPEVLTQLQNEGSEAVGSTPEELGQYMKSEVSKWASAIPKDAKVN